MKKRIKKLEELFNEDNVIIQKMVLEYTRTGSFMVNSSELSSMIKSVIASRVELEKIKQEYNIIREKLSLLEELHLLGEYGE